MKKKRKSRKGSKQRRYTIEFKVDVVKRMLQGENIKALSRVMGLPRSQMYVWLDRYRERCTAELNSPGHTSAATVIEVEETPAEVMAKRLIQLERKVWQQALEVDFLRKAFKRVKELRQNSTAPGGTASTK